MCVFKHNVPRSPSPIAHLAVGMRRTWFFALMSWMVPSVCLPPAPSWAKRAGCRDTSSMALPLSNLSTPGVSVFSMVLRLACRSSWRAVEGLRGEGKVFVCDRRRAMHGLSGCVERGKRESKGEGCESSLSSTDGWLAV